MALCYHTDDIKNFGWARVFGPLVTELKGLETDGINLKINGATCNFKVVLSCVTGDNLFLNGFLGFVESFSANHPCRHCTDHKSNCNCIHMENPATIRTVEQYDSAVVEQNVQETGIKTGCCLNDLTYFHAVTNHIQDLMHDILEGVCSYDLTLICRHLIKDGVFTLATLNSRMQSLDYGYHDASSRPPVITSLENEMLSFEASEMWCFVRYLPAAVGHLIKAGNKFWVFYLQLRQIMDLLFAPEILKLEIDLLRVLVSEYLEMRSSLFPSNRSKNKHHHMIHYPRLTERMGPMSRFWCMRFERKHQRYKRLMHISGNFKNVPKSVATRHQLHVASRMLLTPHSVSIVETGNGDTINLNQLHNGTLIDEVLGGGCLLMDFYKCDSTTVYGTLNKTGCYLLANVEEADEMPKFVHLLEMFIRDREEVIFICELVQTVAFDCHFHAWSIQPFRPRNYVHVNPKLLNYYIPLVVNYVTVDEEERGLIALRYRM